MESQEICLLSLIHIYADEDDDVFLTDIFGDTGKNNDSGGGADE